MLRDITDIASGASARFKTSGMHALSTRDEYACTPPASRLMSKCRLNPPHPTRIQRTSLRRLKDATPRVSRHAALLTINIGVFLVMAGLGGACSRTHDEYLRSESISRRHNRREWWALVAAIRAFQHNDMALICGAVGPRRLTERLFATGGWFHLLFAGVAGSCSGCCGSRR